MSLRIETCDFCEDLWESGGGLVEVIWDGSKVVRAGCGLYVGFAMPILSFVLSSSRPLSFHMDFSCERDEDRYRE